jgi:hypothetical protein
VWAEGFVPEDFSFSRCYIGYKGKWYASYIYYPHPDTKINHVQSRSTIEVISEEIPNLEYGASVNLRVKKSEVRLNA